MSPTTSTIQQDYFLLFIISTRSINQNDVFKIIEELESIPTPPEENRIILILNSGGGDIYSAYKILKLIRTKCKELIVVIPYSAKSAATLMALGSDSIVMGHQSELGPLDAPIEHPKEEGMIISALDGVLPLEYFAAVTHSIAFQYGEDIRNEIGLSRKDSIQIASQFATSFISPITSQLDPLIVNSCHRRLTIATHYGQELLQKFMFKDQTNAEENAKKIIRKLVWEYPDHSFAICVDECQKIGLEITECNTFADWSGIWDLFRLNRGNDIIALISRDHYIHIVEDIRVQMRGESTDGPDMEETTEDEPSED